jgi:hypothetical protein
MAFCSKNTYPVSQPTLCAAMARELRQEDPKRENPLACKESGLFEFIRASWCAQKKRSAKITLREVLAAFFVCFFSAFVALKHFAFLRVATSAAASHPTIHACSLPATRQKSPGARNFLASECR